MSSFDNIPAAVASIVSSTLPAVGGGLFAGLTKEERLEFVVNMTDRLTQTMVKAMRDAMSK